MQKNNTILRIFTLLLLISFIAGCKKNDEAKPATEEDFASAQATLDVVAEVDNLNDIALDAYSDYYGSARISSGARISSSKESVCGDLSFSFLKGGGAVLTVDFGSGSSCDDGVTRKGKIIYTFASSGTSISAKFDGYEANGKKLDGDYSVGITYAEEVYEYNFKFNNAVLTYADGSTVKWNSAYKTIWKWVKPQTEGQVWALQMETSGGISGTNKEGKTFSATITTPLLFTTSCAYGLTKGTYVIKAQGHPDATYEFGDGSCDNTVTLTIKGQTKSFAVTNEVAAE
jgi:hypothetical protein